MSPKISRKSLMSLYRQIEATNQCLTELKRLLDGLWSRCETIQVPTYRGSEST